MPDLDGFEVNLRLKSQPETVHIPVICLSANVQDTARQRALAAGAWTYLTKPYDWHDVVGAVKAAIAETADDKRNEHTHA